MFTATFEACYYTLTKLQEISSPVQVSLWNAADSVEGEEGLISGVFGEMLSLQHAISAPHPKLLPPL